MLTVHLSKRLFLRSLLNLPGLYLNLSSNTNQLSTINYITFSIEGQLFLTKWYCMQENSPSHIEMVSHLCPTRQLSSRDSEVMKAKTREESHYLDAPIG